MRSIFLVALSNLRRRKKQNFLVGLSIFLSVLLLATAIGILGGIHKPFDAMFDRQKSSHILLYYDIRQNSADEIRQWFQSQPEVENAASPQHFLMITEPLIFNEEKIDIMIRLTEYKTHQNEFDKLLEMQGGGKAKPGWGEIWIPMHMANKYHIALGDTIQIPVTGRLFPLKVSSIVVDAHFASGLINPNRLWVASGMLPFMVQAGELNQVMQGIRLKNKADINKVWARFNREMNFSGSNLQYSLFKSVFTSVYKIIGFIIVLFSVLAIIISGYIISSLIISSVLADSRLTGMLKAIGYTPAQVVSVYLIQYLILVVIFLPTGLLASYLSINLILNSLLKSIGLLNFAFPFISTFIISGLTIIGLVFLLVLIFSKKAGKLPPAAALRSVIGDVNISRRNGKRLFNIEKNNLSFWLALKLISDNPKKTIVSIISLVFTVFIIGFSVNVSNSFGKINEYKSAWGFDNSDLIVSRATGIVLPIEHEQFVAQMEDNSLIKNIVPFSYYEITSPAVSKDIPPVVLQGKVYEENPDIIGLTNITGRHPEKESEISLCVGTANRYHKSVGDSILVLAENEPVRFKITGIYQDVSNLGDGFRLPLTAVRAINPIFKPDRYALVLNDKSNTEQFENTLLKKYGEAIKIELTIEDQLGFMGITRNINASLLLISLFFIGILIVSVFNDVFLNVWENRRSIGVFKLIGFSHRQLQMMMIWKMLVVSFASIFIGLVAVLLAGPSIMSFITSGFGVVDFPMVFSISGNILALIILLIFTVTSTLWASLNMKRINPKILVNE